MKRFLLNHGILAVVFLLFWTLLVVVEVKIGSYDFLRQIFFGSILLVFASFFLAGWHTFQARSRQPVLLAVLSSLVLSPVFIFVGVVAVTNFKFLIGGHF